MDDHLYIEYFENLARNHAQLVHSDANKAFFCINNPYDLTDFDNALRSSASETICLLDAPSGHISDNGVRNFTKTTAIDFMIVKKSSKEAIRASRSQCYQIGLDMLKKVASDAHNNKIITDHSVYLLDESIQYDVVGPINLSYYGYSFSLQLCTPFSWPIINTIN